MATTDSRILPKTHPVASLPQELIEAIIDHVASLKDSNATLKSCSLVSKSFYYHSSKLLLSSISFVIDSVPHERAQLFHQTFNSKYNWHLLQNTRSFSLVNKPHPSKLPNSKVANQFPIINVLRDIFQISIPRLVGRDRIKRQNDTFTKVFQVLHHSPLENAALIGTPPHYIGHSVHVLPRIVPELLSISSLKSLHIANLFGFPTSCLTSAVYNTNLTRLSITNVFYYLFDSDRDALSNYQDQSSTIERLDLKFWAYQDFFRALRPDTLPSSSNRSPDIFPRLKILNIWLPSKDLVQLWGVYMSNVHDHLEDLCIECMGWDGLYAISPFNPFVLGVFTALRRLTLNIHSRDTAQECDGKQIAIADFLASATNRNPIEMIKIRIVTRRGSLVHRFKFNEPEEISHVFGPESFTGWTKLDEVLSSSRLTRLRKVEISLGLVGGDPLKDSDAPQCPSVLDAQAFLPLVFACPSISLSISIGTAIRNKVSGSLESVR